MRTATLTRKTRETDITLSLNLDGTGQADISTGIGFFDHMLTAFAVHSGFDLTVKALGDLEVDSHHTVEDVGIVLGQALAKAVDRSAIERYGTFSVPMDEALCHCSLDISGRPYLVFLADFTYPKIGQYDTSMTEHFFQSFAVNAGITLHIQVPYGRDDHHKAEAIYKAVAHALKVAVRPNRGGQALSSKGVL
ncbi:imidazoleglycerol-phosphate dehydratase HisB [Clostridiaceae bacterium NSJ-31]|uniref:Imidazoleglycerol-phosphate dehydratase n=1 Tax=Ligaoa zhengdingensis TaxID=2763658 RepID=A0A926E1C8_9FIRM|nr:imidazoleglycerol-phosphate dehydratase HisB [Ligaoa zhengdingensis]MBC8547005.1 imidazoleglycerol-phosphate dehydratase HisB [Ligaoa zhengdingensis]